MTVNLLDLKIMRSDHKITSEVRMSGHCVPHLFIRIGAREKCFVVVVKPVSVLLHSIIILCIPLWHVYNVCIFAKLSNESLTIS